VEVVDDGCAVTEVVFEVVEAIVVGCVVGWVVILVIVVELLHEVKTRDTTNKRVSAIQITPLFIISSLFQFEKIWEIDNHLLVE
jgi:MFS superfamily sulfate permease-like transporter